VPSIQLPQINARFTAVPLSRCTPIPGSTRLSKKHPADNAVQALQPFL